jgi:putative transcriptional regulator
VARRPFESLNYRSKIMASIHEAAADLHRVGGIDRKTMREFDVLCLTPVLKMSPDKIRALREREKASQTVFAAYLNVTPSLVSKWERGEKHPQGASLKLLSLVEKKGLEAVA